MIRLMNKHVRAGITAAAVLGAAALSAQTGGAPPKSTIEFPGATGGVNWGGAAADPGSDVVFVNAHDTSMVG